MLSEQQPVKRTRMRSEERRALILQRARHVFANSTYADASTGELARESEVTEPMLYKHFGSKKGLFLAVLSECSQQFLSTLQQRFARRAEQDVLDALTHIVDEYNAAMTDDPETQRVLFQAVNEASDPEVAQCISRHNRKVYLLIRQLVERAQESGYLEPTINLDAATWGYMSMILALQYGLMLNLSGEIAKVQEEMGRVWLRGLLTPES
ncbi:TetR family transcriptional regulator [Dictyobacter alpinus]|uniref:TetR family transcriptional regulator n=1 Tax=Dictyobacter alpinus TaxID=2014873 RepID=A0A402BCB2_9CHLR|nr:TetR/AcrR family transcriptional regulator [Dictyobacter alpinus]GCE29051.1 TetR family transcriptional regulator [Dictyobacter alpinus]